MAGPAFGAMQQRRNQILPPKHKGGYGYMTSQSPQSRRRLQREPDFTGNRLIRFRDVFWRHGFPGCLLGLICLGVPGLMPVLLDALRAGLSDPFRYAALGVLILVGVNLYGRLRGRRWSTALFGWAVYLGALSLWEEWVFRVALPTLLQDVGTGLGLAALISSILFGAVHYFTLRWRWQWCVGAALGGWALSRQMHIHDDLLLITAFHWIATYINTPFPPGYTRKDGGSVASETAD